MGLGARRVVAEGQAGPARPSVPAEPLAVVHTVASLDPAHGGPSYTVPALGRALEAAGHRVALVTGPLETNWSRGVHPSRVRALPRAGAFGARAFGRAVEEEAEATGARIVHDHGTWLATNHAAAGAARRRGLPRIVSPRGMLEPWALGWRAWRKRFAWRLYQRSDLERAALLHATSNDEAQTFARVGLRVPVAVIPNGVVMPRRSAGPPGEGPRVALSLSRLHPVKGVPDLLDAWSRRTPAGWELWIAGAGEPEYERRLWSDAEARGLAGTVRFLGPVEGEAKEVLFARASLFVLPSHSENFGLVVAEALAAGVPVLTTRGTPWKVCQEEGCGWWVEGGAERLAAALAEACGASPRELAAMGERGRRLAETRFAWPAVAARMAAVYGWVLGGGDPPTDLRR
jgi:glycosyltransferase involved in cell wall biosynthesis